MQRLGRSAFYHHRRSSPPAAIRVSPGLADQWILSAWYWSASWASRLWFSIVAVSLVTLIALARFLFVAVVLVLRLVSILLLFVLKRLSEVWGIFPLLDAAGVLERASTLTKKIKHVFVST